MSVPAHAPYDWIALVESDVNIKPIQIIEVKGFGTNPAKEVCEQLGVKSQTETDKLDEATEFLYKKEFHTGVLNDFCGQYAGLRIAEIKDTVKNHLIECKEATAMREFSEEVICRCGEKVVIKRIPDQWFIKYSDQKLTDASKKHAATMKIVPEEYKEELPRVLEWFDDRACIRKGSWLGTEFPFKKGWIIEPISDSTLYPVYYIVSKYVNEWLIKPEEMDEAFFDYIFLGKGEAKQEIWKEIQKDIDYWYPVDINLGGKEHKTVHFPVFIMNHVAVLPKKFWPRGIFAHWWVTQKEMEKISKSKGGAEPIPIATKLYGVDTMRLYYAHIGSPFVDVEWDPVVVEVYKNRINQLWNLAIELIDADEETQHNLDRWLRSSFMRRIKNISSFMDSYNLRDAANEIFFEIPNDFRWYKRRGGGNKEVVDVLLQCWIRLIAPFTPHLAEELWEMIGKKGFVSLESYPEYSPEEVSIESEVGEQLVKDVIGDIKEILKVTKKTPKKIYLYTAPRWKYIIYKKILGKKDAVDVKTLMKELMQNEEMRKKGKEVSKFIGEVMKEKKIFSPSDCERYKVGIDEKSYLTDAAVFLQKEFDATFVIQDAEECTYDPVNKSRFAKPLKPAIYIE
ncbi:MAG TPA: leucine--tRNA ligase, partial [Thermoplasmata archaeon]|nr:leucine--tRNA ligase [Thermoplasmata archaeon]